MCGISKEMRAKWREVELPTMAEKNAEKVWKTMAWATYDGDTPFYDGASLDPEMAGRRLGGGTRVPQSFKVETQVGLPQQMRGVVPRRRSGVAIEMIGYRK